MILRRTIYLNLMICILVVSFTMLHFSNQHLEIVKGGDFSDPDLWLCNNNATVHGRRVYLMVNESGGRHATFSSVQQGIYPHGWRAKGSLKEFEVRNGIEATPNTMWITIVANRSEFEFYNETESIVNIGFMVWFQLGDDYHKPINESSQLELDINIASYVCGNWTNHVPRPITWPFYFEGFERWTLDNDYHYVTQSDIQMIDTSRQEITVDVGKCIQKAFNHWKVKKGTIKSFDIYIEAVYGFGEATIEYVDFVFSPKLNSAYVLIQSMFYGILTFLALTFISTIVKRTKRWSTSTNIKKALREKA